MSSFDSDSSSSSSRNEVMSSSLSSAPTKSQHEAGTNSGPAKVEKKDDEELVTESVMSTVTFER